MLTKNTDLTAAYKPCFSALFFSDLAKKAGFTAVMLFTLILLFPAVTQASGLFEFQMKLAKKGNAEAEFKVGEMYETGFGVKQDKVEAMNWIKKAANHGHETASFKLLYWNIQKNGINDSNKEQYDILVAKAKSGNGQAQYYIGKMYARGVGVKRNSNAAISWLNKAALVGVLQAEQEVAIVRENKRQWLQAKKQAEEKKQAEDKKRAQLKAKQQAEAKTKTGEVSRKNTAAAATSAKAKQQAAAEQAKKEKLLAQQQAEKKQREAEKKALLKKRDIDQKKRKTQFESDPCSGKSARFLSTCR